RRLKNIQEKQATISPNAILGNALGSRRYMGVSIFSLFRPAYQGQCDVIISVWMRWKGDLEQRKIAFRVLNMNLDTTTPTGKLILNVLRSIIERELIKERMLVGIAKAKAEGKYWRLSPSAGLGCYRDHAFPSRSAVFLPHELPERSFLPPGRL